jgi:DNA polymerase-3 subunit delta'
VNGVPFAWQREHWQQLGRLCAEGRLPHALLLTAPAGTGLREFTEQWARAQLCTVAAPGDSACGSCGACEQTAAGTHPDLVRLVPDEAGKAIGVDAIRGLIERLGLTASGPAGKVAVVDPADAMTLAAANSLLKTLEEPPGNCAIALVTCRPTRLPATVRSRCRKVAFGLPSPETALAWLRERSVERPEHWLGRAGGAPLEALRRSGEEAGEESLVTGFLDTLEKGTVAPSLLAAAGQHPLESSVPLFSTVMADLLRLRVAGAGTGRLQHPLHEERMARIAARLDARAMFHYLDELNRAVPGPSSSLRPEMQIQGLLADAARLPRSNAGQGR